MNMRAENKGLGGGSSALLFALGGMVGAAVTILAPREGRQPRSGLKEMAEMKKEHSNHRLSPAPLEPVTNKAKAEIEPFKPEGEYGSSGILLD
jgi:hypothetical protein